MVQKFWLSLLGVLYLLLFSCNLYAQDSVRLIKPANSFVYELKSEINATTYQISISLPKNYSPTDSTRYQTVYFLDGNMWFPLAVAQYNTMNKADALEPLIVVAIGYQVPDFTYDIARRTHDYTPSVSARADSSMSRLHNCVVKSGGASDFLLVLEKEIIPFVESHFKTNAERSLAGHSLGGLFTTFALVKNPALFSNYFIFSPSLWWDNSFMFQFDKMVFSEISDRMLNVKFVVGADETDRMVKDAYRFSKNVKKKNHKKVDVVFKKVPNSDHFTALPAFVSYLYSCFQIEKLK